MAAKLSRTSRASCKRSRMPIASNGCAKTERRYKTLMSLTCTRMPCSRKEVAKMKDYDVWISNCATKPWNLERVGPHGLCGASAAFANVAKEEAQKGISSAERSQAQTIENEMGSI